MAKKKLKCQVCGKTAVDVISSVFGAISYASCIQCMQANREPWDIVVGGLVGCKRGHIIEDVNIFIDATCKFFNKTEDDLWAEIEKVSNEYDEHMKRDKLDSKI